MKTSLRVVLASSLLALAQLAQGQTAPSQALITGWNLVGNNSAADIDTVALFGNTTAPIAGISDQIISVWKWDAVNSRWFFFAPSYSAADLAAYAAAKSYNVLTSIASGEGYWVNAKAALSLTLPNGMQSDTPPSQTLVPSWNLVGNNSGAPLDPVTLFGNAASPVSGVSSLIVSVWKWDAVNYNWMYYAPSYDPTGLAAYTAGKSYGVLASILPGEGYWINATSGITLALPPALTGVAATGAPLGGATVTLKCGDGTGKTTTADADGAYSFGLTKCDAPYAVKAVGQIGDTETELVSLHGGGGAAASNLTVNATPITHAVAASIASSGNPTDLVDNYATEKANITAANVSASEQAYRTALGGVLTSAGAATTDSLIGARFKADGISPMDKVLDMVNVAVHPNGEVHLYTSKGAMADDLGDLATPPSPGSVVVLNKGELPQSSHATSLPGPGSGEVLTIAMLEDVRKAFVACFKLPSAQRGTFAALLGDCAALPISATYKHQGRNGSQEFNAMLADASMDGSKFFKPSIVRQLSATRALVSFPFQKVNGFGDGLTTVVSKINNVWMLVGNQRVYEVFVNGSTNQRISVGGGQANRYETGVNLYVRNNPTKFADDATLSSVTVYGPGLPGYVDVNNMGTGATLYAKTGCDFLSLNATSCGSVFRFRATKMSDGTEFTPTSNKEFFANPQLTDAQILAIKPLSLYKFVITTTTGTVVYWERLRARALTAAEVAQVKFLSLSDASKTLLLSYTGGTPPTISWTKPGGAAPAFKVTFFHNAYSDSANVKLSDLSATIKCASNADCTTGGDYGALTLAANSGNTFQMAARNRHDVQIFSQYVK